MSVIWHQSNAPTWLPAGPQYSFFDVAEIVQPAPAVYEEARARLQAWERKLGAAWYRQNTVRALAVWQAKRPWWLV